MAFNLKRLRAERVAAGMTQEQFAKKSWAFKRGLR